MRLHATLENLQLYKFIALAWQNSHLSRNLEHLTFPLGITLWICNGPLSLWVLDVLHRPTAGISVRPQLNRYLLIYTENEMEHLYSKSLRWRSNHRDMLIINDPYYWRLDYEDIKRAVSACMGVGYDFNWLPDQSIWNSAQLMWSFSTFIMLKLLSQAKYYFAGHVMPVGMLNWIKNNDWKVFIWVYGQVHKQYQSGPFGPD